MNLLASGMKLPSLFSCCIFDAKYAIPEPIFHQCIIHKLIAKRLRYSSYSFFHVYSSTSRIRITEKSKPQNFTHFTSSQNEGILRCQIQHLCYFSFETPLKHWSISASTFKSKNQAKIQVSLSPRSTPRFSHTIMKNQFDRQQSKSGTFKNYTTATSIQHIDPGIHN